MTKDEALKLALEALEDYVEEYGPHEKDSGTAYVITTIKEALAQPEQEPDRVKFERHWRKTRGEKKADRELTRHPLQPQTYIQDSANRHWVTWQTAVKSVTPPQEQQSCDKRKPLTDEQIGAILEDPNIAESHQGNWLVLPYAYARAIEQAHGITGEKT